MDAISPHEKTWQPEILLFFINGMLVGEREASLDALELSEFLGLKVKPIYNCSTGVVGDCLRDIWLYFGGTTRSVRVAREAILEALGQSASVTIVTIAHSQGAMVIHKAISLLTPEQRSRIGVVTIAAPVFIHATLGLLFAENITASRDAVPRLAEVRERRQTQGPQDIVILKSADDKRFDHAFLGGTYQKSGWPRLVEILETLKQSLLETFQKRNPPKS